MISKTRGIVLKKVKYGDTSAVVTIYTRYFGLQSYLVNGIFGTGKKFKGQMYEPGSIVEIEAYHSNLKNLQRIKEISWGKVYTTIFSDVVKYAEAMIIIELVSRVLRHEEKNEELFLFIADSLTGLDESKAADAANIPLKFGLKLAKYLGFQIINNYEEKNPFFDVKEGMFVAAFNTQTPEPDKKLNKTLSDLLKNIAGTTSAQIQLNGVARKKLLFLIEQYYRWHIEGFTELKALRVNIF
ncbi:MAG: DNA repair protein RecO [Chitinophagaceae bacterium]|nr:DNA repair protein RecO [Chitinophagaceae bacterium]